MTEKQKPGIYVSYNGIMNFDITNGEHLIIKGNGTGSKDGIPIIFEYVTQLEQENQKLREAIKFYSQKDNFCLYDDISEAEWKDNWIGERYSQFVLSPIGRKAREALNESEEG